MPPVVAPTAFARELGRTMTLLSKAARARRIYQPGNAALVRLLKDLTTGLEKALEQVEVVDLRVRSGGLYLDDLCVLDAPNPDDSLAFAFYRDGLRRLAFHRGLERDEIEVLVTAAASGFTYTGLGEDTVTYLWKHDLENIRYLVVDTTITDAADLPEKIASGVEGRPRSAEELDGAIDGLLRRIYGDTRDDVGITSLSLDRSDVAAKKIADTLDAIDDMAPGFHPPRSFSLSPAYAPEILRELQREDDDRVALRAAHAVLHSVRAQVSGTAECWRLFEVLLKIYDAAIIEENLRLASYVLAGVARCPKTQERTAWLREALAETRLRQVAQNVAASADRDVAGLTGFFRACGPSAVSTILSVLPSFQHQADRRTLSNLVLELGVSEFEKLRELLVGEQAFLAQEAMYILSKVNSYEAQAVLREAEFHPIPIVRVTLLESAHLFGESGAADIASRLIDDPDPKVRIAAARTLSRAPGRRVTLLLESRVQNAEFDREPPEVKLALLASYALNSQSRALPILARLVKRGEGILATKRSEDTAILALRAIRGVRSAPRMRDILERAANARKRRVRETARAILLDMKEAQ